MPFKGGFILFLGQGSPSISQVVGEASFLSPDNYEEIRAHSARTEVSYRTSGVEDSAHWSVCNTSAQHHLSGLHYTELTIPSRHRILLSRNAEMFKKMLINLLVVLFG